MSFTENRRSAIKMLVRCARERSILPSNLFLTGVEKEGQDPVGGGGFSDVWKGTYQEKYIAVKVLRTFSLRQAADSQDYTKV